MLVAVGAQLVSVAVVFYFAPRIGRSTELYGTLGTAAEAARVAVRRRPADNSGAFLNATLWERRYATTEPLSTTTVWPRIIPAAGAARKQTTSATSRGSTSPAGVRRRYHSSISSRLGRPRGSGLDEPGRDRVHVDASRRELHREADEASSAA